MLDNVLFCDLTNNLFLKYIYSIYEDAIIQLKNDQKGDLIRTDYRQTDF